MDKRTINRLGYSQRGVIVIISLAIFSGILEGAGVSLLLPLFSLIQSYGNTGGTAPVDPVTDHVIDFLKSLHINPTVETLLLSVALIVVLRQVASYYQSVLRAHLGMQADLHNKIRVFTRLVEAKLVNPIGLESGAVINALTMECKRSADYVKALINSGAALFKLVIYGGICVFISWQATLITVAIMGLVSFGFARGIMERSRVESRRMTETNEALAKYFTERLGLLRLIKLSHTEQEELSIFRHRARHAFQVGKVILELASRLNAIIEPAVILSVLLLVYLWVIVLETPLANMGVLVIVMMRLLPLTQEALANWQAARTNGHAASQLLKMRDSLALDVEKISQGVPFPNDLGEGIRFDKVYYSYPVREDDATPALALSDISLLIPTGKTTALLGPSGAGKSTLFDLLPRLREPQQGRILFGDTDAQEIALGELRQRIALVSQEALLIDGTVVENLRYGNPDASDEAVRAAAQAAFADSFIQALPQGYDTMLGPRGARLSGGQRQRIALARAMLAHVPILLLDEPTSALDAESEQAVQQALERQQNEHGTTIVIIAHRLSTVSHADLTVVLDQGRVIAAGTHQDLMETNSWYQKIVALQR